MMWPEPRLPFGIPEIHATRDHLPLHIGILRSAGFKAHVDTIQLHGASGCTDPMVEFKRSTRPLRVQIPKS